MKWPSSLRFIGMMTLIALGFVLLSNVIDHLGDQHLAGQVLIIGLFLISASFSALLHALIPKPSGKAALIAFAVCVVASYVLG